MTSFFINKKLIISMQSIMILFFVVIIFNCKKTPVTIINNTGTNIIDGYFSSYPDKIFNILNLESQTYQYPDQDFGAKTDPWYFHFKSPLIGIIVISNIYLIKDWHNNVTINSDNSVTVIQ